eukprot:537736-Lingulodinium_polyedra.AAC.1
MAMMMAMVRATMTATREMITMMDAMMATTTKLAMMMRRANMIRCITAQANPVHICMSRCRWWSQFKVHSAHGRSVEVRGGMCAQSTTCTKRRFVQHAHRARR